MDTQQALLPKDSGNLLFKGCIFNWEVWGIGLSPILVSRAISARLRAIVVRFFTMPCNSSIWRWSWPGDWNRTYA